jgi:3-oxoacyl-[acyl-carrier-protein] synthase II
VRVAAVTAWAVHVPGLEMDGISPGVEAGLEAVPADRSHELLGRRGLLFKEPATRLALCAVQRALGLSPAARRPAGPPDPRTAVVASSNLGNVATVSAIVRTLREGSGRDVSPLDAPNASSNVIASTVAIWFGFGGPNLMVCSGATSGLDAVALALLLLGSRRADRVVVVGTEPDDEVATELHACRAGGGGATLRAGAAAVVLERAADAAGPVRLTMGGNPATPSVLLGPQELAVDLCGPAARVIDLTREIGDTYGALGVLQVAVGAALIASRGPTAPDLVAVSCGGRRTATLCRQRTEV